MADMMWHRRETRRQTEKTNLSLKPEIELRLEQSRLIAVQESAEIVVRMPGKAFRPIVRREGGVFMGVDDLLQKLREEELKLEEERRKPEKLREDIDRQSQLVELHERQIKGTLEEIDKLKSEIGKLDSRIKAGRQEEKKLYILPLIAVILFVAFLVYRGWAEKPTVSIDFNVGEIIGGSLVGIGALIAGVTYAYRRTLRGGE